MSSGDPIKYEQLVDPAAFPTLFDNVNKLIELLNNSQGKIKENLIAMRSILSQKLSSTEQVAELQKANAKIKEQDEALKKLKNTTKLLTLEQAKQNVLIQEANKETKNQAKIALDLTTEYQKQSKALIELRKQAQAVLLSNQEHTVAGKALIDQYTKLDQKLKNVDDALGQHQRHVGNYTHSIINAFKATGGLAGAIDILGKALGIDEQMLQIAVEAHHTLASAARDLHHITQLETESTEAHTIQQEIHDAVLDEGTVSTEANTVAKEENVIVTEEATIAQEANNAAWLLSPVGIMIGVGIALAAIGVAIYEFTKYEEDSYEAITKTTEAFAEQQKEINKLNESIYDKEINFKVSTGELTKSQGEITKNDKKEKEALINQQNAFNRRIESINEAYKHDIANAVVRDDAQELKRIEGKKAAKIKEIKDQALIERALIKHEADIDRAQIQQDDINEASNKDESNKNKLKKEEDFQDTLRHLKNENITYSYDREKAQIIEKYNDEQKKYVGQTAILIELDIARDRELKELYRKQQAEWDKIREDTKNEDIKKVQDDAKKMSSENPDPVFSPQLAADFKLADEQKKIREKKEKEEIDSTIALAEQLEKIEKEHQEKMNAAKIAAIDHDLDRNKSAIEQQIQLAAAGKDNTLAYEMEKQDKLEKERVQELERQKKQAKQMEAMELSLAFIKAYESYISGGTKSGQALMKASGDVLAAKLLSKAIAGSAFDGTENTGSANGQGLDGKGGMLWMLHENEGVTNAKGNKKYKGAVGAMNEGKLEDWAMKNIMLPQYNSSNSISDVSKTSQVNNALTEKLISEVQDMKQAIIDKPVPSLNIDNLGRTIHTTVEKGIRHTTIKKTYLS